MDAFGRVTALRHAGDGQILAAEHAVAAGPDLGQRGAAFAVDLDAAALERQLRTAAVERGRHERLADRLEHLIGGNRQGLAGAAELTACEEGIFELDGGHLAALGNHPQRPQPVAGGGAPWGGGLPVENRSGYLLPWAPGAERHPPRAPEVLLHGRLHRRHAPPRYP